MRTSRWLRLTLSAVTLILAIVTAYVSPVKAASFTETGDAGNSIATAIEVGPGFDGIKGFQYASPTPPDTKDFFKLTFDTDVSFTVPELLWPVANNTNASIHLYDMGGTPLSECFNCFFLKANQGKEILSADLSTGTYFIEVRNTLGTEANKQLGEYEFSFNAVAVPEPTSFMLLGISGLAILAAVRRRKKQS